MLGDNACDGLHVDAGMADAAAGGKPRLGTPGCVQGWWQLT